MALLERQEQAAVAFDNNLKMVLNKNGSYEGRTRALREASKNAKVDPALQRRLQYKRKQILDAFMGPSVPAYASFEALASMPDLSVRDLVPYRAQIERLREHLPRQQRQQLNMLLMKSA